ncbi:MAG: retropepsin-like aspartic protease [Cytophagales bacterium]|nr:retropepsin-like aspartic protease [Cytophagales bacterium]
MTLFRTISFGLLILLSTSCSSILRRTLGNYFYKRDYLPTPLPKDNKFYSEIPYELQDGWTIIKVKLNNNPKEFRFIFDTGARSCISDSIAKELRIYPIRYAKSWDINGSVVDAGLYRINIAIGQFRLENVGVLSKGNFENLTKNCYQIDGIIGVNILNQAIFHFDSEKNVLHITNSIDCIPESKRQKPLKLINHNWNGESFVKVKVNKQKGKFLFDTGSANLLFIEQKKTNRQVPVKQRIGYIGGLHSFKLDTISFYKIQNIRLGKENTKIFDESVVISHSNAENNLGNGILKKYLVTLDRNKKKLYLSPKKVEMEKLEISNVQFDYKLGKIFVSSLTVDCELQKMGLSLGDTITVVNDIKTDSFKDYCNFKSFRDSVILNIRNKEIVLTTKHGTFEKKYVVTSSLFYD